MNADTAGAETGGRKRRGAAPAEVVGDGVRRRRGERPVKVAPVGPGAISGRARQMSATERVAAGLALQSWMRSQTPPVSDGALSKKVNASPSAVATWRKGSMPMGVFQAALKRVMDKDITDPKVYGPFLAEAERIVAGRRAARGSEGASAAAPAAAAQPPSRLERAESYVHELLARSIGSPEEEENLRTILRVLEGERLRQDPAFAKDVEAALALIGDIKTPAELEERLTALAAFAPARVVSTARAMITADVLA